MMWRLHGFKDMSLGQDMMTLFSEEVGAATVKHPVFLEAQKVRTMRNDCKS